MIYHFVLAFSVLFAKKATRPMFQRVAMMRILGQSKGRFEQSNARPTLRSRIPRFMCGWHHHCQRLTVKVSGDARQDSSRFGVGPVNKRSSTAGA